MSVLAVVCGVETQETFLKCNLLETSYPDGGRRAVGPVVVDSLRVHGPIARGCTVTFLDDDIALGTVGTRHCHSPVPQRSATFPWITITDITTKHSL